MIYLRVRYSSNFTVCDSHLSVRFKLLSKTMSSKKIKKKKKKKDFISSDWVIRQITHIYENTEEIYVYYLFDQLIVCFLIGKQKLNWKTTYVELCRSIFYPITRTTTHLLSTIGNVYIIIKRKLKNLKILYSASCNSKKLDKKVCWIFRLNNALLYLFW